MTASERGLRLVDLEALMAHVDQDLKWMKILRDARVVEVNPTTYVETGKVYMMDLSQRWLGVPPLPDDEGRVGILCSFEEEPNVRRMIEEFRRGA